MSEQCQEDDRSDCEQPALRPPRFLHAVFVGLFAGRWRRRKHSRDPIARSEPMVSSSARHSDPGVAVVAFDDGASLAGNESIDSCVTTSEARSCRERLPKEYRLSAAAPASKPAPHTSGHSFDVLRRRAEYAAYKNSPAPAVDIRRMTVPSSRDGCRQPRRSQVGASERRTVRLRNCSDSIIRLRWEHVLYQSSACTVDEVHPSISRANPVEHALPSPEPLTRVIVCSGSGVLTMVNTCTNSVTRPARSEASRHRLRP